MEGAELSEAGVVLEERKISGAVQGDREWRGGGGTKAAPTREMVEARVTRRRDGSCIVWY